MYKFSVLISNDLWFLKRRALYLTRALTIWELSEASRACLSQRAQGIQTYSGYLKGNISSHGKWLSQSFRWMPVGSRRGPSGPPADIKWKHRSAASLSLPRIHLIFAQIDIAKELCLCGSALFFPPFFFYVPEIPRKKAAYVCATEADLRGN